MSQKKQNAAVKIALFGGVAFIGLLSFELWPSSPPPESDWTRARTEGNPRRKMVQAEVAITESPAATTSPKQPLIHGPTRVEVEAKPTQAVQASPITLRKNIDYFADYDVDAVTFNPGPADRPGQRRLFSYVDPATATYAVRYVSNRPKVFVAPDFLTDKECDDMVALAKPKLMRSRVVPFKGVDQGKTVDDVRTSTQTWLDIHHPVVEPVVKRILDFMKFPPGSSEMMQVLRYEVGQKYNAHHDYFDPKLYGKQYTNRAATVFLYLNDCEEGGETQFPRADGKGPTWDFTSCSRGIRVRPKKRMIAVFYDMHPDGRLDDTSLHGGCPVKRGQKFGGTLWLRMPTP